MSKYTLELRYLYENELQSPPPPNVLSLLNVLKNYPIENENFIDPISKMNRRDALNKRIIEHFYFREIGFETANRFLFALSRKLNEIMIIYNQQYKSIDLDINPINNVDMTETFSHEVTGNGKTTTNSNSNSETESNNSSALNKENLVVNSDTPNQSLTEDDIKDNKYASTTMYDKSNDSDTSNSNTTSNDESNGEINQVDSRIETYTRKEFGSSKGYTFAQNIEQWRNIMINIDMSIINDLETLFMNKW